MGIPIIATKPNRKPSIFHIDKFLGTNKSITPTQIADNESPDMLNMKFDEAGALDERFGYGEALSSSLGNTKINGMYQYGNFLIIAQGTNLIEISISDLKY